MKLNFLKMESYKRGIILSSGFSFLSKFLLFLQSVVVAYYFGSNIQTDVYFYCFTTITMLSVFINGLDSSVLIPESMHLSEQVSKHESMKFLNFFIYLYFFLGICISLLIYISPVNFFLTLSNFDLANLSTNKQILLLSIPLFTLMITTNLLGSILASHKFFTIPMIVSVINSLLGLLFVFIFHNRFSLLSILIGQIFAFIINISFLIYLMRKNLNWDFTFTKIKLRAGILNNIGFAQAGNITSFLASYVPIYLLSGFNPGIITALIYGQKTAELPTQLITNQATSVVGIKLNELFGKKNHEDFNKIFLTSVRLLLFIMTPISCMLFLYSENIISILFQRGAFDVESVKSAQQFFKYFILLLPMLVINAGISRLFMAGQKIKQSFYYQIMFNIVLISFIFLNVRWLGVYGYPAALILLHIFNVVACYWLLKILFPKIEYINLMKYFLSVLLLNCFLSGFIYILKELSADINSLLSMILGCAGYLILLLFINSRMHLNLEIDGLLKKQLKKIN